MFLIATYHNGVVDDTPPGAFLGGGWAMVMFAVMFPHTLFLGWHVELAADADGVCDGRPPFLSSLTADILSAFKNSVPVYGSVLRL